MVQFRARPAAGAGGVTAPVRVLGVPKAVAKLKGVDSVVRLNLGLLMKGAAEHIEKTAKELVPVKTGNLKSGISSEKTASYSYNVVASSEEGSIPEKNTYEYSQWVEFDPLNRRFMTRAYESVKPLVAVELSALAKKIERL